LLKNPSLEWDHTAITIAHPCDVSVRTEKWAYIRYNTGDKELYDMTKDEIQRSNLAENTEYAAVNENLRKYIPQRTANFTVMRDLVLHTKDMKKTVTSKMVLNESRIYTENRKQRF
jgi:hypothetical protein